MKTNKLVFKTSKKVGDEIIEVTIKLADECKNGHQDFSITAYIFEAGKPKIDSYIIAGGCCHDEILKAFPEFKIFIDLHLSDCKGRPMYAFENGRYHVNNSSKKTAMNYLRINEVEYNKLHLLKDEKTLFELTVNDLGLFERWENEANEAIKILENLTGEKFLNDSVKYHAEPIPEAIVNKLKKLYKALINRQLITYNLN